MKKIIIKRLVYHFLSSGNIVVGNETYDGHLSDENILNSVHEVGKTEWRATNWVGPGDKWENELWLLKPDPNNANIKYPVARIYVETFYQYQKRWYELLWDKIRRI